MTTRILVPVDGSEPSQRATAFAAKLARAFSARVVLLYVFDAPSSGVLGLTSHAADHLKKASEQLAADAFAKAQAQLGDIIPLRLHETGEPAKTILAVAAAEGIDHIVMGSRGLSPIKEIMMGSVSENVLQAAPCPVTILR